MYYDAYIVLTIWTLRGIFLELYFNYMKKMRYNT